VQVSYLTFPYQAFYRQLLLRFGQIPNIQKKSSTIDVSVMESHGVSFISTDVHYKQLIFKVDSLHQFNSSATFI